MLAYSLHHQEEGISPRPTLSVSCLEEVSHFLIDGCFNHWENNMEVYERSSIRNIVLSSLEGINGTLFMYGQTGAGKTYTMLGNGMISGVKTRQVQFDQADMSPRSARLQAASLASLRRSVSSARSKKLSFNSL